MGLFSKLFSKKNIATEVTRNMNPTSTSVSSVSNCLKPSCKDIRVPCNACNGNYKVKNGKYGIFAGCSNYPSCKSTLKLPDLVLNYIQLYGINIYRWYKECYKCGKETAVYSYYLDYDLAELDKYFSVGDPTVGLGDLSFVDELLSKRIPTIQLRYSNTTESQYMANICEYCGALQGRYYVVDDPHEIVSELWHDRRMEKFLFSHVKINKTTLISKDIERLYI